MPLSIGCDSERKKEEFILKIAEFPIHQFMSSTFAPYPLQSSLRYSRYFESVIWQVISNGRRKQLSKL
jgi:hypothetical protein